MKNSSNGTSKLDKILNIGNSYGNKRGLEVKHTTSVLTSSKKMIFVLATQKNPVVPTPLNKVNQVVSSKTIFSINYKFFIFIPTCFHCEKIGHTKPKCFELLRNRNRHVSLSTNNFSRSDLSKLMAPAVRTLCKLLQSEQGCIISRILSDHRKEFDNSSFKSIALKNWLNDNFWSIYIHIIA